ncbi:hypothetical protein DN540_32945, partial [Burkholderia multivorans]
MSIVLRSVSTSRKLVSIVDLRRFAADGGEVECRPPERVRLGQGCPPLEEQGDDVGAVVGRCRT